MAKSSKTNKSTKKEQTKNFAAVFYLSAIILITFLVYFFSLTRTWQPFDERLFYNEEFLPIPLSFSEIFEIIKSFVLNSHIVSMNSFFSNYIILRGDPVAWSILTFIFFFFKKHALLYHLFQLFLHLINTTFLWLILYNIAKSNVNNKASSLGKHDYILISIFTGIWSLHSINTEAVLLVTNWNALLIYSFCFGFFLYETLKTLKKKLNVSIAEIIFIPLLFCFAMSIAEFGYTLPFILFFTTFAFLFKETSSIKDSFKISFKRTTPYFIGLALFIIYLVIKPDSSLTNLFTTQKSIYFFFERNLWLTPQIFVHFLKLLFFPKTLSTYQSNLIPLSDSLFSPYSIFCTSIYLTFLILPVILFTLLKKSNNRFLYPLIYCFYFSLFPFLHILAPTYCLIADRYCYFPSFIFIFFILNVLFCSKQKDSKLLIALLSCILLALTIRTFIRTQDWNNPTSFYSSVLNIEKNSLYKGQKLMIFADFLSSKKMNLQAENTIQKSLKEFNAALKELTLLREKHLNQPVTLKLYGLDYESLTVKAAHGIAMIREQYLKEPVSDVIQFFEPYIYKRLGNAAPNEISFYGDILLKNKEWETAKSVYESGYKTFPFVLEISLPLADLYLTHYKNSDQAFQVLQKSYRYYPNKGMPMYKLLKYYEEKKDPKNEAKFSYLLGLREHSIESYQHATQIYLDLNKPVSAKKTLDKLIQLNPNNPLTLFQLSRYMDLTGNLKNIPEVLNKAYLLNKTSNTNEAFLTKAILVGLININYRLGNLETTKKHLYELESIKDLLPEDIKQIKLVKEKLEMK